MGLDLTHVSSSTRLDQGHLCRLTQPIDVTARVYMVSFCASHLTGVLAD